MCSEMFCKEEGRQISARLIMFCCQAQLWELCAILQQLSKVAVSRQPQRQPATCGFP
jgi:hypothetical protein